VEKKSGRLIDWVCGPRNKQTLKILLAKLSEWNVSFYCTDFWKGFSSLISFAKLIQGKAFTYKVEQNNSRARHWFARFRRKSLVISRSLEMVDLTMALFAKFRVNGTLNDIDKITI